MAAAVGTTTIAMFQELFEHLAEYHWIHDLHLTKFLESRVWTKIPHEWHEAFRQMTAEDLSRLPFPEVYTNLFSSSSNHCDHPVPSSLQQFLQKSFLLTLNRQHIGCRLDPPFSLTLNRQQVGNLLTPTPVGKELARGMSPKKLHEVEWMASLVHQVAMHAACDLVIDIGSGLGYVGQVLHTSYGLPVIGLEGSVGHTERAEKRAAKHGLQCSGMKSVPFEIRDDADNIRKFYELVRDMASTMVQCEHSPQTHLHSQCSRSHHDEVSTETELEKHSCGCDIQRLTSEIELNESASSDLNFEISQRKVSQSDGTCFVCRETMRTEKLCIHDTKISENVRETRMSQTTQKCVQPVVQELKNSVLACKDIRVCLIGLHCCGDLTPALLRLFQQVDLIQAVCCVSCCYHKMQLLPATERFYNFPMSGAGKEAYTTVQHRHTQRVHSPENIITPCSLRLAAQETRSRWASQTRGDHEAHSRHVAFRAVLELLAADDRSTLVHRKTVRKLDYSSLDQFLDSYISSLDISDEEKKETEENLQKLSSEVQPLFHHIEPFTCLQVILQPVLESVILQDRQRWLEEHGFSADIVPIFDEQISPRNLALVSLKL